MWSGSTPRVDGQNGCRCTSTINEYDCWRGCHLAHFVRFCSTSSIFERRCACHGIRRLTHVRFEQKGTKETKGEKEAAITGQVPTALPICFFFESQTAIGAKGRTEVTIVGEVLTYPSSFPSFPSFASVQCLTASAVWTNSPKCSEDFAWESHLSPYLIVPAA